MSSSKELREFADECSGWAKTARTDKERHIFLQMSRTWLWAAARLDGDTSLQFPSDLVSDERTVRGSAARIGINVEIV
jgi:hypothetical protein